MNYFRKILIEKCGTNQPANIVFVEKDVFIALFEKNSLKVQEMMIKYQLSFEQWKKFNRIRRNYNYCDIQIK